MGKQVNKYRAFSSAQLKAKADIPAASDIVEQTNYIDCSNIKMSAVKTLLSAGTWSLYDLCRHANVNEWSGYGPTKREVVGGVLTNRVPTTSEGFSLGSFAGYNHGAVTPAYYSITHDDDVDIDAGQLVTFSVILTLGEARLVGDDIIDVSDTDRGIGLAVFDGANILTRPDTTQVVDVHDLTLSASYHDTDKERVELVTTYTVPAGTTHALEFDCKIYLVNKITDPPSIDTGTDVICQFTEFADYTKTIIVRTGNFVHIEAPENNGGVGSLVGDVWTFGKWELKTFSWSASTGILQFAYLKLNENLSGGYNHLSLDVYVERGYYDTDGATWVVDDTYSVPSGTNPIYDDSWNTAGTPPPEAVDGATLFPSGVDIIDETITNTNYGYRIVFDCDVTTV